MFCLHPSVYSDNVQTRQILHPLLKLCRLWCCPNFYMLVLFRSWARPFCICIVFHSLPPFQSAVYLCWPCDVIQYNNAWPVICLTLRHIRWLLAVCHQNLVYAICAMWWITFEARPFPVSIKHSINKTLSGGRSLLSMLGWFCVM